jgi:hypothetical protein
MSAYVFISYGRADRAYVDQLAAYLRKAGIVPWYDYELVTGDRWERVVRTQVDGCAAFMVVMTPDSDESNWVEREIIRAEANGKPIVPLLLRGEPFFRLANIQADDVTGGRMPARQTITRLHDLTTGHADHSDVQPSPVASVGGPEQPATQQTPGQFAAEYSLQRTRDAARIAAEAARRIARRNEQPG